MKKLSILVLVACLFCSSVYSSEPLFYYSQPQENLTNLEQLMTDLQNESWKQKILIESLQKALDKSDSSVKSLTRQLTEISELSEKQSKLLKKQDTMCNVLKWSLAFTIPIAFTTGLILGYKMKE